MKSDCKNYYKICRIAANLIQEQAVVEIEKYLTKHFGIPHLSVRSLSDYENFITTPPDYVVVAMVEVYKNPRLALWHIKTTSPLGDYLPEIQEPQTNSDIYLQADFAQDEIGLIKSMLKEFLKDGVLTQDESSAYQRMKDEARWAAGKLISIYTYEPVFEEVNKGKK